MQLFTLFPMVKKTLSRFALWETRRVHDALLMTIITSRIKFGLRSRLIEIRLGGNIILVLGLRDNAILRVSIL